MLGLQGRSLPWRCYMHNAESITLLSTRPFHLEALSVSHARMQSAIALAFALLSVSPPPRHDKTKTDRTELLYFTELGSPPFLRPTRNL